jgi:hypothetical protein
MSEIKINDRRIHPRNGLVKDDDEKAEAAKAAAEAPAAKAAGGAGGEEKKAGEAPPKAGGEAPKAEEAPPKAGGEAPKVGGEAPKAEGEAPKAEGESAKGGGDKGSGSEKPKGGEEEEIEVTFSTMVIGFATTAMLHMGEEPPAGGKPLPINLKMAKHFIDLLGILQKKSAGNLTIPEDELLKALLFDLRMKYVALTK